MNCDLRRTNTGTGKTGHSDMLFLKKVSHKHDRDALNYAIMKNPDGRKTQKSLDVGHTLLTNCGICSSDFAPIIRMI